MFGPREFSDFVFIMVVHRLRGTSWYHVLTTLFCLPFLTFANVYIHTRIVHSSNITLELRKSLNLRHLFYRRSKGDYLILLDFVFLFSGFLSFFLSHNLLRVYIATPSYIYSHTYICTYTYIWIFFFSSLTYLSICVRACVRKRASRTYAAYILEWKTT